MKLEETSLSGLYVITPEAIVDNRGFFAELYHGQKYAAQGLDFGATRFAQQNVSVSRKNVIRGLHFQWDPPLGKMVRVTYGRTFSVAVDIRKKSQTFGRYFSIELSRENQLSLYAPPGFAYGFCSLEDDTAMQYLYTSCRNANTESIVRWSDPQIGIKWPLAGDATLSEKDATAQPREEWIKRPESHLF